MLSLAALSPGYIVLLMTSELGRSLRAPYIAAARARGIEPWRLTAVHAMRPSLIPVATFLAANLGQLVTALLIVEGIARPARARARVSPQGVKTAPRSTT